MSFRILRVLGVVVAVVLPSPVALGQEDGVGVGVNVGSVSVDQPLRAGESYRMPSVGVVNTGHVEASYSLRVTYREGQAELRPPPEWFRFDPDRFLLEPGEVQSVSVRLSLPASAETGDYFAFLEAFPVVDEGGVTVGVAAAAKLTFTVEPGDGGGALGGGFLIALAVVAVLVGLYALWRWFPLRLRVERRR